MRTSHEKSTGQRGSIPGGVQKREKGLVFSRTLFYGMFVGFFASRLGEESASQCGKGECRDWPERECVCVYVDVQDEQHPFGIVLCKYVFIECSDVATGMKKGDN